MSWDAPEDPGPQAEMSVDHGDGGISLSPWAWVGIVAGLLLAFFLFVRLL